MNALLFAFLLTQAPSSAAPELDRAVRAGISGGVYPGAVVVVGTADTILLARGFGHFTWSAASPVPDPAATLYDLASLTKVVATTPAVMLLVDQGRLDLARPVQHYLPEFTGSGKEAVTVSDLLAHTSGLRAFLRLDTLAGSARDARQIVLQEPLRWPAGKRIEYSDLNAMLLGWIVERVSGLPLDQFIARELYIPLGFTEARFNPARSLRPRIAPVGLWRGHAIAGEIHDQNAARLNGVSGHAGLYATGLEVGQYAQLILRGGLARDGRRLVRAETVQRFIRGENDHRALGWELRDTATADNAGSLMGAHAFGHTGYTGTSVWIDPDRRLFVVLLTNRVYAPRNNRSISALKRIRGEVADAAFRLADQVCGTVVAAAANVSGPRC